MTDVKTIVPEVVTTTQDNNTSTHTDLIIPSHFTFRIPITNLVQYLVDQLERTFSQGPCILYEEDDGKEINVRSLQFQCQSIPSITLLDYFQRLAKHSHVSAETVLLSVVQIAKFSALPDVHVTQLTLHRLLLTSLVVAAKFWDDRYLFNKRYAYLGGVETKDLNQMEIVFLALLSFDLYVSPYQYDEILMAVIHRDTQLFVTIAKVLKGHYVQTIEEKNPSKQEEKAIVVKALSSTKTAQTTTDRPTQKPVLLTGDKPALLTGEKPVLLTGDRPAQMISTKPETKKQTMMHHVAVAELPTSCSCICSLG